jgi:hypothetical protein
MDENKLHSSQIESRPGDDQSDIQSDPEKRDIMQPKRAPDLDPIQEVLYGYYIHRLAG